MTAYEVLRTINTFIDITEIEYNGLIANFHNSFLGERNYEERLMLHRNPVELQNEMLRDVYKDLTTIQRREELRHVHSKGERLISTYVVTEIEDVWKADKRLPSLFFAIKEFSKELAETLQRPPCTRRNLKPCATLLTNYNNLFTTMKWQKNHILLFLK